MIVILWNKIWDKVVLIGDAAHPTTPYSARSTNMAIIDAAVSGKCLDKWGPENLQRALEDYQSIRLPVTSAQVLHSRLLGRMKQALPIPGREPFGPKITCAVDCELLNKNVPLIHDAYSIHCFVKIIDDSCFPITFTLFIKCFFVEW